MGIEFCQWLVAKSLYQECFGVFGNGYVYPLIMHLLFGAIAGIIGSGLILWTKKYKLGV
ncbi:hypothetical protein [Anabaena sp. CCY 9910]|uniref:hypothetical protein n=1 Tax=Anabaena sp. CCY 9910 TaxID=3103870 RepID=UPI0039E1F1D8